MAQIDTPQAALMNILAMWRRSFRGTCFARRADECCLSRSFQHRSHPRPSGEVKAQNVGLLVLRPWWQRRAVGAEAREMNHTPAHLATATEPELGTKASTEG